ncbi:hypothetical protein GCM10011514_22280 [Emticicia aquatilis]|uniref:Adhesin domain-containing protein n=2 Tax=Emticicia aquatilis TaxID=1537369 RepID=A0A916YRY7_9BACT|nr:hypothetical protein GCM10011514_22280 [Emticicia aquatilis]
MNAFAQNKQSTFKQSFSGADKRVLIMSASNNLTVEGITGTEVIIESDKQEREFPEEAQGLKIVSPGGAVDNTGIGASVQLEGNTLKIKLPKSKYYGNFVVKIPKDLNLTLQENGNPYGKWLVTSMKGEVEANTSYTTLNIKNVSGPIVARCGYGKVFVEFDELSQTRPNSISANGAVDITLPATTKANLKVQAMYGEFFTDFDIQQMKVEETKKDTTNRKGAKFTVYNNQTIYLHDNAAYDRFGKKFSNEDYEKIKKAENSSGKSLTFAGSPSNGQESSAYAQSVIASSNWELAGREFNTSMGSINGGGVNMNIRSDFGNVYLRKKK